MFVTGKYVVFGQAKIIDPSTQVVLERLNSVGCDPGSKEERPSLPVWIGDCGLVS